MSANLANTVIQVPNPTSPADTEKKTSSCLSILAVSQCAIGTSYAILSIIEVSLDQNELHLLQLLPAFVVILAQSLLLCCKRNDSACCGGAVKGHFVLAIIGSILLFFYCSEDILTAFALIYQGHPHVVLYFFYSTLALVMFVLLIWSAVITGKQTNSCCCCGQSNTNYQPQQVVYLQQGTPENPQLIMMQPSAPNMQPVQPNFSGVQPMQPNFNGEQPIKPYFNGTVPSTALIIQPGIEPSQIQPTLSPNQGINTQESSPEVDDVAPEVKPETNDVSNVPDMVDEENQLLIPE